MNEHNMHPGIIGIILMALQFRSRSRARSLPELSHYVDRLARHTDWPLPPFLAGRVLGLPSTQAERLKVLQRHLHGMEVLGLAVREQGPDAGDETTLWRSASIGELNEQVFRKRGDGGGNGRDPGDRRGGGDGGDGGDGPGPGDDIGGNSGGGIREVLSHPYLFALPAKEFDTLVDDMFAGSGAP